MTRRFLALLLFTVVLGGLPLPRAYAHHGPPHEEIDEFEEAASRLAAPGPSAFRWSWPALVTSMAGVAAAWALSRKFGEAEEGSSRAFTR